MAILFWLGVLVLLVIHVPMLAGEHRTHAVIALTGTVLMFVGSKIGRAFLGLE